MEVAAGAVAAEQVVTTTVEGSALAAVAIAKPTGPLKATFTQVGTSPQSDSPDSLARSSHTITYLDGDLYIHGGLVTSSTLAGPEMHILKLSRIESAGPDYKSIPALAENESDATPCARAGHAAVSPADGTHKGKIFMYGGFSDPSTKAPIEENGRVWAFDSETMLWTHLDPSSSASNPGPRAGHALVSYKNTLILHGGQAESANEKTPTSTWQFDLDSKTWAELPSIPATDDSSSNDTTTSPPLFTIANGKLWLITVPSDQLATKVHYFDLPAWEATDTQNPSDMATGEESAPWVTLTVPTNPLTPGPTPRSGGSLHAISTGLGRWYLLLMLGIAHDAPSTLWTLQLPSSFASPAAAKDAASAALPKTSSHALEWHAVDIVPKDEGAPGAAQQTWLGSARSGVHGFLKTNVGGAASWVRRKASVAGGMALDMAGRPGDASPAAEGEGEPGPVLEDKETPASPPPDVTVVPPVPDADDAVAVADEEPDERAGDVVTGKAHPGPRGYFGSAVLATPVVGAGLGGASAHGAQALLWGGLNAKEEREGDGWLIELRV